MDDVRVDRWLCAARIFKSRTQAGQACAGGHVQVNGTRVKAHRAIQEGDELRVHGPAGVRLLRVLALAEKRLSPALARDLYHDHTPPPEPRTRELGGPIRPRGVGRPTKRERRLLQGLRGR